MPSYPIPQHRGRRIMVFLLVLLLTCVVVALSGTPPPQRRLTKAQCEEQQTVSTYCYALRCGGVHRDAPGCPALLQSLHNDMWKQWPQMHPTPLPER